MRIIKHWNRFPEVVDPHSINEDGLITILIISGKTTRGQGETGEKDQSCCEEWEGLGS